MATDASTKPAHKKQISVDSGVGSTCSIHSRRPRPRSAQRVRSISGNSTNDTGFVMHEIPTERVCSTCLILNSGFHLCFLRISMKNFRRCHCLRRMRLTCKATVRWTLALRTAVSRRVHLFRRRQSAALRHLLFTINTQCVTYNRLPWTACTSTARTHRHQSTIWTTESS